MSCWGISPFRPQTLPPLKPRRTAVVQLRGIACLRVWMQPQILQGPFPSTFSKRKVTLASLLLTLWPRAQPYLLLCFIFCTMLPSRPLKRWLDQEYFFLIIFFTASDHSTSVVQLSNIHIPSSLISWKRHSLIPFPLFQSFPKRGVRPQH